MDFFNKGNMGNGERGTLIFFRRFPHGNEGQYNRCMASLRNDITYGIIIEKIQNAILLEENK
jgi:hypothetical protein